MDQRVDVPGLRIIAGGRAWPFEVDCRADCARIELNGTSYVVRPLRWRDKHVLARFAVVGEMFLKREFVRLCLAEPANLPAGDDDLALLFELARWYNSPDGREMLPFDPTTLSRVTIKLCQNTRLAPEHFDHRNAIEIESLWHATRTSREIHEEIADPLTGALSDVTESHDATKILILPDPNGPGILPTTEVNSQGFEDGCSGSNPNAQVTFVRKSPQNPRVSSAASKAAEWEQGLITERPGAFSDAAELHGATKILILPDPDVPDTLLTTEVDFQGFEDRSSGPNSAEQVAFVQGSMREPGASPEVGGGKQSLMTGRRDLGKSANPTAADSRQVGTAKSGPARTIPAEQAQVITSDSDAMHGPATTLAQPVSNTSVGESATQEFPGSTYSDSAARAWREGNQRGTLLSDSTGSHSLHQTTPGPNHPTSRPFKVRSLESGLGVSRSMNANRFSSELNPLQSLDSILVDPALSEVGERGARASALWPAGLGLRRWNTPEPDLRTHDSRTLLTTLPPATKEWLDATASSPHPPSPPAAVSPTDLGDPEAVFDELADRLAEAAMQLGIDVDY